ncbi:hypothetical protein BDZ45DRAFT_746256 [Acephala macrosclerotiorum]|nr:hypothetical protein BDZ45DRAFT_746256 [Acephala macrosclerotiorum]
MPYTCYFDKERTDLETGNRIEKSGCGGIAEDEGAACFGCHSLRYNAEIAKRYYHGHVHSKTGIWYPYWKDTPHRIPEEVKEKVDVNKDHICSYPDETAYKPAWHGEDIEGDRTITPQKRQRLSAVDLSPPEPLCQATISIEQSPETVAVHYVVDLILMGLDRFTSQMDRGADQRKEDDFAVRLKRIGGKWWPNEMRYLDVVNCEMGIMPWNDMREGELTGEEMRRSFMGGGGGQCDRRRKRAWGLDLRMRESVGDGRGGGKVEDGVQHGRTMPHHGEVPWSQILWKCEGV